MAALTENQRAKLWRLFMEKGHTPPTISKASLRAAIDALDDWVDGTGTGLINSALPQPFRAQATVSQKALILAYVALERAGVL